MPFDQLAAATYMDVLTQMDSPALVIVADAVQLDVLMADNGSKTFLYLRSQGSTANEPKKKQQQSQVFYNAIQSKNQSIANRAL